MDLANFSIPELKRLQKRVDSEIKKRDETAKRDLLKKMHKLAAEHGLSIDDVVGKGAERAGYHPEIIQSGRRINDRVGQRVARECVRRTLKNGSAARAVTVLGLTFKENVPDLRNSKVADIVAELRAFGIEVQVHDPLADGAEALHEFNIPLTAREDLRPADAVILAVPHEPYRREGWALMDGLLKNGSGLVMDIRACLDEAATPAGIELWRL